MSLTKEDIINAIAEMSVKDVVELITAMEEKFGVTAAVGVAVAAADAGPAAEEKTEFDVVLTSAGEKKVNVIKAVRALTGLGLKEAKELVESAPAPVQSGVPKAAADEAKAALEEAGASVEIK